MWSSGAERACMSTSSSQDRRGIKTSVKGDSSTWRVEGREKVRRSVSEGKEERAGKENPKKSGHRLPRRQWRRFFTASGIRRGALQASAITGDGYKGAFSLGGRKKNSYVIKKDQLADQAGGGGE